MRAVYLLPILLAIGCTTEPVKAPVKVKAKTTAAKTKDAPKVMSATAKAEDERYREILAEEMYKDPPNAYVRTAMRMMKEFPPKKN